MAGQFPICAFIRSCEKFIARNVLQSPPKEGPLSCANFWSRSRWFLLWCSRRSRKTTAPPDFSGTWVLNAAKGTIPKDSTIKSQTIVIDNKKSAIVFHYKTDGKKLTETYTPDGKKHVSLNMSSGQLTSSASWRDSVLVIESTLDIKVPNATVVVTGLKG